MPDAEKPRHCGGRERNARSAVEDEQCLNQYRSWRLGLASANAEIEFDFHVHLWGGLRRVPTTSEV